MRSACNIEWKKKFIITLSKAQGLWTLGSFFCCWLLEASIAIEAALCDAGRSCDDIDGGGGWGVGPETGLPELHGALAPSHHSSHPRTPTEIFIINYSFHFSFLSINMFKITNRNDRSNDKNNMDNINLKLTPSKSYYVLSSLNICSRSVETTFLSRKKSISSLFRVFFIFIHDNIK